MALQVELNVCVHAVLMEPPGTQRLGRGLRDRVQWQGGSSGQTDTRFTVNSFGVWIDKGNMLGMGGVVVVVAALG